MGKMLRMETDTTLFISGVITLGGAVKQGSVDGVYRAMERFRHDAIHKVPMCPVSPKGSHGHDAGWMRDHHKIEVHIITKGTTIGTLKVTDSPYAASLHEGISRWGTPYTYTKPGSGMKWIESKIFMYGAVYVKDMANTVSRAMKSRFMKVK